MSEWISVKDKVPEEEDIAVLCLYLSNEGYTYYFVGFYDYTNNSFESTYSDEKEDVMYWMPLPKPPIDPLEELTKQAQELDMGY